MGPNSGYEFGSENKMSIESREICATPTELLLFARRRATIGRLESGLNRAIPETLISKSSFCLSCPRQERLNLYSPIEPEIRTCDVESRVSLSFNIALNRAARRQDSECVATGQDILIAHVADFGCLGICRLRVAAVSRRLRVFLTDAPVTTPVTFFPSISAKGAPKVTKKLPAGCGPERLVFEGGGVSAWQTGLKPKIIR